MTTAPSTPRFFLAKYVPDLVRMEPKNIGVVAWAEGQTAARFLGEDRGEGTLSRLPRRLGASQRSLYQQWVEYWRHQLQQPSLTRSGNGRAVPRESPEFLDVLATKSKPGCMLVDAGIVRDDEPPLAISTLVDELFETLVLEEAERTVGDPQGEAISLRNAARAAFSQSNLKTRDDYREKYDWLCLVNGVQRTLRIDHALKLPFETEPPTAIFQHVLLKRQNSVMGTAFLFDRAKENGVRPERCTALVYATERDIQDGDLQDSLDLLASYGAVVNLSDLSQAIQQLSWIAS